MIFATCFLFTAGYHFPGGASHYPNWALSIVNGTKLTPDVAQREVGLPLLYVISGFPFWKSFIGITLIFGALAVITPLLVYWAVAWASPTIAYYTGLVCIFSLAPFTYMKFLYPDQLYMCVNLLAITLLVGYLWSGKVHFLYCFTLAAVAASFTRTAGNLMFPVLLAIAFFTVKGRYRHYLACALIFVTAAGAYQWHRYEIFDMRNQPSKPSGMGMQMLYSTYLYLGDFGYRLSPDIGPNTKRLFERMREELRPTVRDSPLIKKRLGDSPPEFMEKYFYALTPEQLIEKIATQPNEEYYWNVVSVVDTNDQFSLEVAKEIARAYPWYIVRYGMRNLWHAVFDPGYATTRYNTLGFIKTGGEFPPGSAGWGVRSEDPVIQYGQRAAREMEYFPLKERSAAIQHLFASVEGRFLKYFHTYVWLTSVPIFLAWIGALLGLLCALFPRTRMCRVMTGTGALKITAPVIAATALLIYEDLATALFSQPVYRYFHMTEPWRLVIGGFGMVFAAKMVPYVQPWVAATEFAADRPWLSNSVSTIQRLDLLERYFSHRRAQWVLFLTALNMGLFAWWAISTKAHTEGPPPVEIVGATYGQNCRGLDPARPAENRVREGNVTNKVRETCIFYRCTILVDDAHWGDPAPGCAKDFSIAFRCRRDRWPRKASIAAPATGKTLEINCYAPPPTARW